SPARSRGSTTTRGCCSTTATSSCTSFSPRRASSMASSGFGPTRRASRGTTRPRSELRRDETPLQPAVDTKRKSRVLLDLLFDDDVTVTGQRREHRVHLGERELLADATARTEAEREQGALLPDVGREVS